MMIERIILLAGVALLILLFVSFVKKQQFKKARSAANVINRRPSTQLKLQVIYFWSTQCSQCISVQTPIIDNLIAIFGKEKLTVNKFNVSESPEQAKNWGVKTVPTTYVLDAEGNVLHMNNGLVTEKTLSKQLESMSLT